MPNSYPVNNPSTSFWIDQSSPFTKVSSCAPPQHVDVVIIGSGYTGTSVACNMLLENHTSQSVLMVEARDVCSGATGRNGGHLRSYYYNGHAGLVKQYGQKVAAELTIFEDKEMRIVEKIVNKYEIDCLFERRQSCQTFETELKKKQGLNDYYAYMNNPYISDVLKKKVCLYFGPQAQQVSGCKTSMCITSPTASVWPYRMVCGLLEKCVDKGLRICTHCLVKDLERTPDSKWTLRTSKGPVTTSKVVVATNAWTRAILPEFQTKIVPVKGCVSHLKPVGASTPRLRFNYYHAYPLEGDYVTARTDNAIIVGGGGQTYLHYPYSQAMINNTDDSTVPENVSRYFHGYASRRYMLFSDTPFENDYTWTGCMGYTDDELPLVGDLAGYGRPNVYISAGYTGHGMPRIWSCGRYIADLVRGATDKSYIPGVYKLTPERMDQTRGVSYLEDLVRVDPRNCIFKL